MDLMLTTGLILAALGVAVWLFGNRMWLLGAGAGALLGFALLNLIPSLADGTVGLLVVIGLAILFGVLGFMGKAFAKLLAMGIGFVIGGGLALNLLGMLGASSGFMDWIIAVVAGVVVALLFSRFLGWSLIIFASLLGSMLIVRGAMAAFPDMLTGPIGTAAVLALTAGGIFYHYRKENPATASTGGTTGT